MNSVMDGTSRMCSVKSISFYCGTVKSHFYVIEKIAPTDFVNTRRN